MARSQLRISVRVLGFFQRGFSQEGLFLGCFGEIMSAVL